MRAALTLAAAAAAVALALDADQTQTQTLQEKVVARLQATPTRKPTYAPTRKPSRLPTKRPSTRSPTWAPATKAEFFNANPFDTSYQTINNPVSYVEDDLSTMKCFPLAFKGTVVSISQLAIGMNQPSMCPTVVKLVSHRGTAKQRVAKLTGAPTCLFTRSLTEGIAITLVDDGSAAENAADWGSDQWVCYQYGNCFFNTLTGNVMNQAFSGDVINDDMEICVYSPGAYWKWATLYVNRLPPPPSKSPTKVPSKKPVKSPTVRPTTKAPGATLAPVMPTGTPTGVARTQTVSWSFDLGNIKPQMTVTSQMVGGTRRARIVLEYPVIGWVGLGIHPNNAIQMVGMRAVIGMDVASNPGKPAVGLYNLASKTLAGCTVMSGTLASHGITDASFVQAGGKSTLSFTVSETSTFKAFLLTGGTKKWVWTTLVASGGQPFAYHVHRDGKKLNFWDEDFAMN